MACAATITESEDDGPCHHESSSQKGANPFGAELSQEEDEGLFIPSYLEEALPDDPVLQMKMAMPCVNVLFLPLATRPSMGRSISFYMVTR